MEILNKDEAYFPSQPSQFISEEIFWVCPLFLPRAELKVKRCHSPGASTRKSLWVMKLHDMPWSQSTDPARREQHPLVISWVWVGAEQHPHSEPCVWSSGPRQLPSPAEGQRLISSFLPLPFFSPLSISLRAQRCAPGKSLTAPPSSDTAMWGSAAPGRPPAPLPSPLQKSSILLCVHTENKGLPLVLLQP